MRNLKSKKLYFQVYDEIKSYISKNNLKPGDKLPTEMAMMEKLGVSRNVVREAIKTLEIIGVVSSKPGVGMVLNPFSSDFLSNTMFLNLIGDDTNLLAQSLDVRRVLEMGFAKQAFGSITKKNLDKLKTIVCDFEQHTHKNVDFYELDSLFHKVLFECVGNDILTAFIDSAWMLDSLSRITQDTGEISFTIEKHKRIVSALEENSYEDFLSAMSFHFDINYKKGKSE